MAYIAFEHARSEKNPLRRLLLTLGNRNEIIHCEFILTNSDLRLSAWQKSGVQLRSIESLNLKDFIAFDLGSGVDGQILNYFREKSGSKYDTMALLTDMLAGFRLKKNDRFFCSEICYDILRNEIRLNIPDRIPSSVSPQQLYNMILELPLKQVYL